LIGILLCTRNSATLGSNCHGPVVDNSVVTYVLGYREFRRLAKSGPIEDESVFPIFALLAHEVINLQAGNGIWTTYIGNGGPFFGGGYVTSYQHTYTGVTFE